MFSENFRCNLTVYESESFSDSSLHHIFEYENFRVPFSKKSSLTWVVKIKLQKIDGNLLDKRRKLYMNATFIFKILSRPQARENSRQYLLLWTVIFNENSHCMPLIVARKRDVFFAWLYVSHAVTMQANTATSLILRV